MTEPAARPSAAARPRRNARPTARGWTLAAVGAAALIGAYSSGRSELLYLGLLLLLLPAVALVAARVRPVDMRAQRRFSPPVVAVGRPARVELAIVNTSYTPSPRLAWRDGVPWGADASGALPPLAGRRLTASPSATSRTVYDLVPPRRGVFEIGPVVIATDDPFSLAHGDAVAGGTDALVVGPRIATLPDNGLAVVAGDGASTLIRRSSGGEDDLTTREYRPGDALRRVHWRATARHGDLMVRQEEPRSHAEARIILDTRRSGYADFVRSRRRAAVESDAFELALSITASIALHLDRAGYRADIVETAPPQLAPVSPVEPFLRSLALADPVPVRGDDPPAALVAARSDEVRGSVFAVLADADGPTLDRIVAQRPWFDLAVAFVIGDGDSPQLSRLAEAGWTCVDARPDDRVEDVWAALAAVPEARRAR